MAGLKDLLNWGPLLRTRRNHALEHASLQILAQKKPGLRAAGYSDSGGFWVMGDVSLEDLQVAVEEAMARLRGGESRLAIHPFCGTNFATTGLLAGTTAWMAMLGTRNRRDVLDRWPLVISLVTIMMIAAQPLGPAVQQHVTTEANIGNLQITGMTVQQKSGAPVIRVTTRQS
jgi:hypothetical protein